MTRPRLSPGAGRRAATPAPRRAGGDPDLAAVHAAQQDRSAFDLLYRRHVADVYSYAFYQLGDHHDAEDATARTFLAALRGISRFDDRGASFRAWLFRIARNTVANTHRSRRRRPTTPLDDAPPPLAANADPAGLVTHADELRQVQRALATLADDRRQVILLRFVEQLSAAEIGAVLDRSEGAVRVLLHRALRELAERLNA